MPSVTDFLYPFIEGDERDAAAAARRPRRSAEAKAADERRARAPPRSTATPSIVVGAAGRWPRASRAGGRLFTFGNGGSSTDAAVARRAVRRAASGRALPARCLVDDPAVLTALGNDVGFDLVFSRQLIAHARAGDIAIGLSTSGNSRNVLVAFAEARRRGLLTVGLAGYDGGEMAASRGRRPLPRRLVRQRPPHPGGPGGAGVRAVVAPCRTPRRPMAGADRAADDREAAVLDRIEAFRRRRPRLTDDVITLAHGAGGKASAALVDAVFLEAFAGPDARPARRRGHARSCPAATASPSAPTRSSCAPARFPGGSIGHLAVHGTVNDVAVQGGRPAWLSAAFVIEEGFAVAELRGIVADMAEAAAAAGRGDRHRRHQGRRPRRRRRDLHHDRRRRRDPRAAGRSGPSSSQPGDRVLVSGTIGDHGMAVMLARGDLALEADIRSDTAPLNGLVEALLAAAPGTRWLRDPTRGGRRHGVQRARTRCRRRRRARRDRAARRPRRSLGACDLLGIDPLYVANEGKLVAVVAPDEADAALAALRAHPLGAAARRDRRDRRRARGHRRAAHRRSAARGSSTCSSAIHCRGSADVGRAAMRTRFRVTGTVQGVGFRPFVYRHASSSGSPGSCATTAPACSSRSRATRAAIDALAGALRDDPRRSPASHEVIAAAVEPLGGDAGLRSSSTARTDGAPAVPVSVDTATVPGVPRRGRRPGGPALPLPVHELHRLRAALHDRRVRAVRPAGDDDGRLHDVRGVPGRVRRSRRPPLPRPAERLPGVRAAASALA